MGAPLGNQNAARGGQWKRAIKRALAREHGSVSKGLEVIAAKLVADAVAGDRYSWDEIGTRIDGKPAQAITGEGGGPLDLVITTIERRITDVKNPTD